MEQQGKEQRTSEAYRKVAIESVPSHVNCHTLNEGFKMNDSILSTEPGLIEGYAERISMEHNLPGTELLAPLV